jgi:hypothetical protein
MAGGAITAVPTGIPRAVLVGRRVSGEKAATPVVGPECEISAASPMPSRVARSGSPVPDRPPGPGAADGPSRDEGVGVRPWRRRGPGGSRRRHRDGSWRP